MARRGWSELSESYRQRLERGGITRESYTAGAKLSAARGHAKTPEHGLEEASKHPDRYRDYLAGRSAGEGRTQPNRAEWVRRFVANYDRHFGGYFKYNRKGIVSRTRITDPDNKRYIHTRELIQGANASEDELMDLASQSYPDARVNPFYYH